MTAADAEPHPTPGTDATAETGAQAGQEAVKPTQMERREQHAGWIVAGILLAAIGASWAVDPAGGSSKALERAALGAGLVALLAAAVWYGQRVIASIAAILAGLAPLRSFGYVTFATLAYGGYLMFRTSRAQAKLAATRPRPQPKPSRRARAAASEAAARPGGAGAGAGRPSANRRYTPPKSKGTGKRR